MSQTEHEPASVVEPAETVEPNPVVEPAETVERAETPETPGEDAFGDGPGPGLAHDARLALATLMTHRFITRAKHPAAWDALLAYEPELRERLADLFLDLEVDRELEVAFKRQVVGDGIPVLLRRDRALSRDASLLLVHLRTEHAHHDALDEPLVVTRDQVADFLNRFSDGRAHDQVALDRRVDAAVRALELYHLLEPDDDDQELMVVSPAVVPLVTPDVLLHLRDAYTEAAARAAASGEPDQPETGEGAADETATPGQEDPR